MLAVPVVPVARSSTKVQADSATPRVLVVLVAHDGAPWLPRTLAALDAQTHGHLEVVAVDNGSTDASRQLMLDHLGDDRVLVADRDLGFGAAVSMALDARVGDEAPYLLLLHDDAALDPDAIAHLVEAMEHDPNLAIVGPKLRSWDDPNLLQSVGWTVDLTGRADSGVDEGELDQGQRDQERRTLYVSTCGMLVRRDVFERLGRFDRRYHVFRDDLDLCWRAWLSGHDVEVVPAAVAQHVAGATNYLRLGQTRFLGPRYFSERNTLATLLKNYAAPRLLAVVPLYFLVGIAKVLGFILTRRVSEAWQTVRAWIWNGLHLVETLRLRRQVQAERRRSDAELRSLFGRIVPRVRAYAEAMGDWVAGGDVEPAPAAVAAAPAEPETATQRVLRLVQRRPVLVVGTLLTVVVLVGAVPLLFPGSLRGGEFAPWPEQPAAFLADYVRSWHTAGAFGTGAPASPAQAVLGLVQLLALGSAWAAPRLLLLGSLAVGWVLALRAAQVYSDRRPARVAAATAYVLSPPSLAALATGRLGGLVVLATLPGIVAAGSVAMRRGTPPDRAWRAVASIVLLGAVAGSFEPIVLPVLLAAAMVTLVARSPVAPDAAWRRSLLIRSFVAGFGPSLLLLPWSGRLVTGDGPLQAGTGPVVADELWRWMLLAPQIPGAPGPLVGVGFVLAGLLGLALGLRHQPRLVVGLWLAALLGSVGGWAAGRVGLLPWPGLPLLVAAAAYAGLLAVAFASAEAALARHDFGWRHLAAGATAAAVLFSLGTVGATLLTGPWEDYAVGDAPLPSFVTTAAEDEGFRALVLADDGDAGVWEVVDGAGPSMAAYGLEEPAPLLGSLDGVVSAMLAGTDPGAAGRLGAFNIRYVVVPDDGVSERLDAALRGQLALEPRPVAEGRVLAISTWLPHASVVPTDAAAAIDRRGELPEDVLVQPLTPDGDRISGEVEQPGQLLVAEHADDRWRASVGGQPMELGATDWGATIEGTVGEADSRVVLEHDGDVGRVLAVTWQILAVLLTLSLALRPPGFARALREESR
jgi:GT2 family glycosyltransferase